MDCTMLLNASLLIKCTISVVILLTFEYLKSFLYYLNLGLFLF